MPPARHEKEWLLDPAEPRILKAYGGEKSEQMLVLRERAVNGMMREALLGEFAMRLHDTLLRVRPKQPSLGVRLLLEKALRLERSAGLPLPEALNRVHAECTVRVERMLAAAARVGCPVAGAGRTATGPVSR